MTERVRCSCCSGSGKVMGGGMIFNDCDDCDGVGKIYTTKKDKVIEAPAGFKIDKRKKHYKNAIARIKEHNTELTDEQAEELFDKEFEKLDSTLV